MKRMNLNELLRAVRALEIVGPTDRPLTGIASDSRLAGTGSLFVAVRGTAVDGHAFIPNATAGGASAVVCEALPEEREAGCTYIRVADSADALGRLASAWNGFPSEKMILVGVTGTNGKTTIATLLYELFRKLGYKAGLLSTVCNYIDGVRVPATHTTPDPLELNGLLGRMAEAGCEYVFMEASSHAIDQKRIAGLAFDGGIFTNLTRDHLDYHLTVEAYLKAKKKFFDDLPAGAFALTNTDDKSGPVMLQNTKARKLTYSLRTGADFKARMLESHFEGMELEVDGRDVFVPFVGRFNAYNLLAVYGAAVTLGRDPEEVLVALSALHPVAGRFETIASPLGYTAIVDYAHTPDALANVLNGIREVLGRRGRVITVVGAGGNRDAGKRPLMAQEAAKGSDQVILTSDNPRFEDPEAIIHEMAAGLGPEDAARTLCITDRAQAIRTAAALARKGDVILVAGKGHEDYQEVAGVKHHFDDREQLREIFANQSGI